MSECVQISNATRPKLELPFAIGSVSPLIGTCLQPVFKGRGERSEPCPLNTGWILEPMSKPETNYPQIEELLAIVFDLERFNHYTYGRKILVETDHEMIAKKLTAT